LDVIGNCRILCLGEKDRLRLRLHL
jgi:hypothetical protein